MIGWASASTLAMTGSSISSGSVPRTRADAVAHVVGRGVGVAVEAEAHGDLARFSARLIEFMHVDALDAGERILERLGDLALDDLRRWRRDSGVDRDDRLVDVGIFAHRQALVGDEADEQHREAQHRGEDRPA